MKVEGKGEEKGLPQREQRGRRVRREEKPKTQVQNRHLGHPQPKIRKPKTQAQTPCLGHPPPQNREEAVW